MDIINVIPAPFVTLAVAILKFFGVGSDGAPWVALGLAVVAAVIMRVLGVSESIIEDAVTILITWLGSMGTWEGVKNLFLSRWTARNE